MILYLSVKQLLMEEHWHSSYFFELVVLHRSLIELHHEHNLAGLQHLYIPPNHTQFQQHLIKQNLVQKAIKKLLFAHFLQLHHQLVLLINQRHARR